MEKYLRFSMGMLLIAEAAREKDWRRNHSVHIRPLMKACGFDVEFPDDARRVHTARNRWAHASPAGVHEEDLKSLRKLWAHLKRWDGVDRHPPERRWDS